MLNMKRLLSISNNRLSCMLHINHKKVTVKLFEVCIINTNWLRSNNVWSLLTIDFTKSNLS